MTQIKKATISMSLFLSFLTGCSQDNKTNTAFEKPGYNFPFQLSEPDQSWKLPNSLVEISGLSYIDNQRLACVQDEKGIVYIFNLQAGEVELEINFGDDGDYEGIEIVENDAWVLKSNGTLYKVEDYLKTAEPSVKKYATALSGKNDAEGLAYDPVLKNLLIACKEDPFVDEKDGSGYKAIYSFSPETKQIDLKPFLLINQDTIKYYNGDATFKPSGIAIHPITGEVYILGSVGKLLLVFSKKGEMLTMIKLSPKVFPQPEGICFSPEGTLFISNEGAGREGTILKFEY
jgi:uncharacterized protein YjiK